ncbi:MAG: 23S rRNA (uracil(1939)-C(5))-methyltransferase RlmD [Tissierellia bacterium]|nr:23S rRNA (uracil(1939)-C(5))-methyltransferase RlmD [Tissierellia bacterium]
MKTGAKIQGTVTDYDHKGRSIVKVNGAVVFTHGGFIGDTVAMTLTAAKKNHFEAVTDKILKATSAHRPNPCPHKNCRGCHFQGWSYEKEVQWKEDMVKNTLERIGGIQAPIRPLERTAMEGHRNHMQFHGGARGFGLYGKNRELVPITHCLVQSERAGEVLRLAQERGLYQKFHLLSLRTDSQGRIMATFVGKKPYDRKIQRDLTAFAIDGGVDSIHYNENTNPKYHFSSKFTHVYGEKELQEEYFGNQFPLAPQSFFQVNRQGAQILGHKVQEALGEDIHEKILDLYCGVGTFTSLLAPHGREVIGIEQNPTAVENARAAAEHNGHHNLRFLAKKAENALEELEQAPQWLLLDPPRAGTHEKLRQAILQNPPQNILYISCNPATLARDLKQLKQNYHIQHITPVDMFPKTSHVEALALLTAEL